MLGPAFFDEGMSVTRHIRLNQFDLPSSTCLAEQQDQNRVCIAFSPTVAAPGLHNHPVPNDHQSPALQHATERREPAADFSADDYLVVDRCPVFFRIEIDREQFMRRCGEQYFLIDHVRHGDRAYYQTVKKMLPRC